MTSFLTAALIILSVSASPPQSDPKDAAKAATPAAAEGAPVWLRGNTHTHTLWSDGDAPPETAIAWYVDHDYDFLVLSDHNLVQTGERWFDVSDDGRLTPAKVDAVTDRFGTDFAELREGDGGPQMRLRRLDELKSMFDRDGEFVLIPGEEVTSSFRLAQVHINAINVDETIPPIKGESVQTTIQANLDAIAAWGAANDRPVLAHLNHPNFRKSLSASNLAEMRGERFFEVYNGHRSVENERIGNRPSMDEMWDLALIARLHGGAGDGGPLYGLATDDAHDHYENDAVSIPGRGWIMVRAASHGPDDIVRAMRAGDFYASSGVELTDVREETDRLVIDIDAEDGVTYLTEFIGVPIDGDAPPTTRTLMATDADPAVYEFKGDELYVRARVTSSRLHPRPYRKGDFETAWTQPVRLRTLRSSTSTTPEP
ncbi:MAG: PHP domain-containing protein [Planctomycetota bacterium]|jgi:hypothetical protein